MVCACPLPENVLVSFWKGWAVVGDGLSIRSPALELLQQSALRYII
ncbi:unnamed protein product [Larinioides sclopetarius]|uniref:Uncharacterized protein n=1 Tax=Larinioides sclopetarius TaxID=280406 RepID=A0AAV1ZTM7_9ARAC